MREFAEAEIVVPSGPYQGRRFKCDRNPFSATWFDAIESGKWRRIFATGPSQTGKTLLCFVVPLLYHLFEIGETVVCGVPSLDMIADKWNGTILPAINASRFKEFLPRRGSGSRGGTVRSRIDFTNGATLRFMTGGGDDKTRAHFDTRVLVVTETDGFDEVGGVSREADKFKQLEARTRSHGDRARIYAECTVSIEAGRTWQEYTSGTQSRLAIQCPHCKQFVTPEREHLVGWKDAANVMEAGVKAALVCPGCGELWSEQDRVAANQETMLLHKGQKATSDGAVEGDEPQTDTLGFRWTAVNNLMVKTAVIGMDEWRAAHELNEENAEKAQRQFVWALPHCPSTQDLSGLSAHGIAAKTNRHPRGVLPPGIQLLTVGIDVGKWMCHWTAIAWGPHATPYAVDYGTINVPSKDMAVEDAILAALRDFRDTTLKTGWKLDGGTITPAWTFIDRGYFPEPVFTFCAESGEGYLPSAGVGATQMMRRNADKRQTGSKVVGVGDHYAGIAEPGRPTMFVEVDADYWKSWLHARLAAPMGTDGSFTLYEGRDHLGFAKQLTAEKKEQEFVPGKGLVTRWAQVHSGNHFLDSTTLACVAGHVAGARLFEPTKESAPTAPAEQSDWSPSYRRW